MNWLWYLLEANLYLLAFYSFYLLFLQHETFYTINRFYLIFTSILSFLIPIFQLGILKPKPEEISIIALPQDQQQLYAEQLQLAEPASHFSATDYLLVLYFVAVCMFSLKLAWDIFKILQLRYRTKQQQIGPITIVDLTEETAFSFFNWLFVHPKLAQKKTVMEHEMVHIKQKHSLDILLFEILQIVSWFNPVFYFMKKDLKLIHEYIADELSTPNAYQKHEYAMFLIENSFGITPSPLTNQFFNQSILKRRINMLNKKRTVGWTRLRLLLALPLTAGMLCTSTMAFTKDYGYVDLLPEKSENTSIALLQQVAEKKQDPVKVENIKIKDVPKKAAKRNQVKFPPPVVKSQTTYFPSFKYDTLTKKHKPLETRYIVINGKPVTDLSKFYGVVEAESVIYVKPEDAKKKYGQAADFGAVEITGSAAKTLDNVAFPPPIVKPLPAKHRKSAVKPTEKIKISEIKLSPYKKSDTETIELALKDAKNLKLKNVKVEKRSPKAGEVKSDSVEIINLSLMPSRKKKLDSVKVLNIKPLKTQNKKAGLQPKAQDIDIQYQTAQRSKAIKSAVELEIKEARKTAEIEIVPIKKN